jgi:Tfp pilus assembly protein PilO
MNLPGLLQKPQLLLVRLAVIFIAAAAVFLLGWQAVERHCDARNLKEDLQIEKQRGAAAVEALESSLAVRENLREQSEELNESYRKFDGGALVHPARAVFYDCLRKQQSGRACNP